MLRFNFKLGLIFLFSMLDYYLTYFGVSMLKVIEEGNPILIWLFEMPLVFGSVYRLIYTMLIIFLIYYIGTKEDKMANKVANLGLFVNMFVIFLHMRWLIIT